MRNRGPALGTWLLAVLACAAIVGFTRFRTDMAAFLPRAALPAQLVLTEQATNGAASHIILVGIGGAAPTVLAALSKQMAVILRREPAFVDVANGDDGSFSDVRDMVWRNRYLLSPDVTADRFTEAGLHAALTGDLALLSSDLGPFIQQSLPADPTGETRALLRLLTASDSPRESDGVWVSADGAEALLLLHTRAAGFDIDAQQRNLILIGAAFDRVRAAVPGAGSARLIESGPGVFAVRIRDTTKRDVTRLSLIASAGAVGLLAFAYRSPLVMLLGLLPVASGALAGIAVVSVVFRFVHGVTLGFGVTLIGESLDYAIYLFSQTRRGDTAHDTLGRIWPTLRLGMLTSVAGFCTMLFSNFVGFAQLGLFSIVGLARGGRRHALRAAASRATRLFRGRGRWAGAADTGDHQASGQAARCCNRCVRRGGDRAGGASWRLLGKQPDGSEPDSGRRSVRRPNVASRPWRAGFALFRGFRGRQRAGRAAGKRSSSRSAFYHDAPRHAWRFRCAERDPPQLADADRAAECGP